MNFITRSENGVLCNGHQPGQCCGRLFDNSKFDAVKLLSGCEAYRCLTVFHLSSVLGFCLCVACIAHPCHPYMLYINHGKEVYMANILPKTEVRGSLQ